jgi:hypothetical protein
MMGFDTIVLERRRAAREEEAEGAEMAISSKGALAMGQRARGEGVTLSELLF